MPQGIYGRHQIASELPTPVDGSVALQLLAVGLKALGRKIKSIVAPPSEATISAYGHAALAAKGLHS